MIHRTLYFSGRPVVVSGGLVDIDMIAEATFTPKSGGPTIRSWMVGWRAFKALERAAQAGSPLMEWKEATHAGETAGPSQLGTRGQAGGGRARNDPGGLPRQQAEQSPQ